MSFSTPSRQTSDVGWRPPTTYVDVLFLILTFFITTAVMRGEDEQQIDVSLPATESQRSGGQRTHIVVTVMGDGRVFLGDHAYELEELRGTLVRLAKEFPSESLLIRGDRDSRLGTAVKVMDMAYAAGVKDVFLATIKPPSQAGQ